MSRFVSVCLVLLLCPFLLSMSKKKNEYSITFHSQGEDTDNPKTIFPIMLEGRQIIFKILPEVSHVNVVAFHPFPSQSGEGYGVTLQLDFSGRQAVEMLTRMKNGQYFVALVNGKPVDYVVIDQVISDGVVTIWQGVPEEVVKAMEKKIARIKPGTKPSSSEDLEMTPSTKKEKKRFFQRFKKEEEASEKDKRRGSVEKAPEMPSLNLPSAPVSPSIPVEGAETPSPLPSQPASTGPMAPPSLPSY